MTHPLRIVSIGAHPADVFDQAGGTIAHHTSRGDYAACIVLTHGARVHDVVISDGMQQRKELPSGPELLALMAQRADVKANEVRAACRILGVEDVYFFGADDAVLLVTDEAVRRLARMLRELRPDIVLTHYPKESDGLTNDHAIGGQIAMRAIGFAGSVDPGDRNPPHRTARTFFFGQNAASLRRSLWEAEGSHYNNVFVDITDVIEKKLAAYDCMVSQGYAGAVARKFIEVLDGSFGCTVGCAYAEGFISAEPEVHSYLPINEYALDWARSSEHDKMARYSYRLPMEQPGA